MIHGFTKTCDEYPLDYDGSVLGWILIYMLNKLSELSCVHHLSHPSGSIEDLVTDWAQKREVLMQTEFADRVKLWEQDDTAAASKQPQISSAISLIQEDSSLRRFHDDGHEHLWLLERKCPEYRWK